VDFPDPQGPTMPIKGRSSGISFRITSGGSMVSYRNREQGYFQCGKVENLTALPGSVVSGSFCERRLPDEGSLLEQPR